MSKSSIRTAAIFAISTATFLAQPVTTWSSKVSSIPFIDLFAIEEVYANEKEIVVVLDNNIIVFSGTKPLIQEGRTLVPIREVFESMGFAVNWNTETQTVMLIKDDLTISIVIGESAFTINEKTYNLDVPAQIINGSTMLPLRAVSEATGAKVEWDNIANAVLITTSKDIQSNQLNELAGFPDAPENWEPVYLGEYLVSAVTLPNGKYLYLGESKESVDKRIGIEASRSNKSADDPTCTWYVYYGNVNMSLMFNSDNELVRINIGPGNSYAGYTVGGAFPARDAIYEYEGWSSGMGAYWDDLQAYFDIGNVRFNYFIVGKDKSTTNPRPTEISVIVVSNCSY